MRVGLSGTPQQNQYSDWFPVLKFLRVHPLGIHRELYQKCFVYAPKSQYETLAPDRNCILAFVIQNFSRRRSQSSTFAAAPSMPPIRMGETEHNLDPDDGTRTLTT